MGYSILPSVTKADKFDNLSEIIRESLLKQVDPADVDRYVTLLEKNSIDFDWAGMSMEFLDRFFYGGHFIDIDISTENRPSLFGFSYIMLHQRNNSSYTTLGILNISCSSWYQVYMTMINGLAGNFSRIGSNIKTFDSLIVLLYFIFA